MKAAYIEKFGGPEVLTYGTLPDPVAGAGQVVVDAKTASVNGADPKVVLGDYKQTSFPLIIGRDFSGVVASVGEGVSDLKVGDEVFGVLETGRDGTYCEKIAVGASIIAKKPAGVSHVDAVAVALTGLTAICAVEEALKLKAGETILVQGGAGGVASFAIQLAKSLGARVISTTSTGNVDYVRGLGADEVIDYRKTDFRQVVKGIDAVFETVGGDVATQSFEVLKPGGRAAFIASGAQAPKPERTDVTAIRPAVPRTRAHLERVATLLASGAVKPPPVTLFPLADAQKALRVSAERHLRGKLILTMAG